uniref:Uncharacterized protein n=1 Tax=Pelusios castaneus TaxID=367368 RepID=A0A8C8S143_9SAUR
FNRFHFSMLVGHLERAMAVAEQIKPFKNMTIMGKMLPYYYYTAIALAIMTYPLCVLLLYSIYKRQYLGMLIYIAWLTFYDLANCLIVALSYQVSKEAWFSLSPLEWFGLATRIPMDCQTVSEPPRFRLGSTGRKLV